MRYLITFSYDGTNFNGYQKQPKLRTIQGELEHALKKISGGLDIEVNSSGRTDRGVHAINQKAHFDLNKKIALHKLQMALNTYTGKDIYIKDIKIVDNNFHARYMVRKKEYIYKINTGEYNPIDRNYIYQYNKELNIKVNKSNDAIINLLTHYINESFVCLEVRKMHSQRNRLKNKYKSKFTNNLTLF